MLLTFEKFRAGASGISTCPRVGANASCMYMDKMTRLIVRSEAAFKLLNKYGPMALCVQSEDIIDVLDSLFVGGIRPTF